MYETPFRNSPSKIESLVLAVPEGKNGKPEKGLSSKELDDLVMQVIGPKPENNSKWNRVKYWYKDKAVRLYFNKKDKFLYKHGTIGAISLYAGVLIPPEQTRIEDLLRVPRGTLVQYETAITHPLVLLQVYGADKLTDLSPTKVDDDAAAYILLGAAATNITRYILAGIKKPTFKKPKLRFICKEGVTPGVSPQSIAVNMLHLSGKFVYNVIKDESPNPIRNKIDYLIKNLEEMPCPDYSNPSFWKNSFKKT